jgi:hypothetical protein
MLEILIMMKEIWITDGTVIRIIITIIDIIILIIEEMLIKEEVK